MSKDKNNKEQELVEYKLSLNVSEQCDALYKEQRYPASSPSSDQPLSPLSAPHSPTKSIVEGPAAKTATTNVPKWTTKKERPRTRRPSKKPRPPKRIREKLKMLEAMEKNTDDALSKIMMLKGESKHETSENESQTTTENESQTTTENESQTTTENVSQTTTENESQTTTKNESQTTTENESQTTTENESQTTAENESQTTAENDSQTESQESGISSGATTSPNNSPSPQSVDGKFSEISKQCNSHLLQNPLQTLTPLPIINLQRLLLLLIAPMSIPLPSHHSENLSKISTDVIFHSIDIRKLYKKYCNNISLKSFIHTLSLSFSNVNYQHEIWNEFSQL